MGKAMRGGHLGAGCVAITLAIGSLLTGVVWPRYAHAEEPRLHLRTGAAVALTGFQADEFGTGFGVFGGLELPVVPQLGWGVELGGLYLSQGERPRDSRFQDAGPASAWTAALSVHVRPFHDPRGPANWLSQCWAGASFGGTVTGPLTRMLFDAAVGLDLSIGESGFAFGPQLSVLHVFQPDAELRSDDANILVAGLHFLLDGTHRKAPISVTKPQPKPVDGDKDGVPDAADACPDLAEDADLVEDVDGCPEQP